LLLLAYFAISTNLMYVFTFGKECCWLYCMYRLVCLIKLILIVVLSSSYFLLTCITPPALVLSFKLFVISTQLICSFLVYRCCQLVFLVIGVNIVHSIFDGWAINYLFQVHTFGGGKCWFYGSFCSAIGSFWWLPWHSYEIMCYFVILVLVPIT